MKAKLAILLVSIIFPASSIACSFDTDCKVGSRCKKEPGRLEGYCVSGSNPGNDNDSRPYNDPIKKGVGETCSFTTECEIGLKCVKESGSLYGVCAD